MTTLLYPQGQELVQEILHDPQITYLVGQLQSHHLESYEHSLRVGALAVDVGYENTLAREQLLMLGRAAVLHDIGKRDIPYCILGKEGPLTNPERKRMDAHVRAGFRALAAASDDTLVRKILVQHHEYQQRPYPRHGPDRRDVSRATLERRSSDAAVLCLAQMLAAADVFDALAHRRSYKEPLPKETIERIFQEEYRGSKLYAEQVLRRFDS
ncbi:HD domain-containing protein [Candidatus Woesearchaeota archaeon]|nr:HD domain-containing protein [Candidatus Woesearchaeota archaeon]